MAFEWNPNDKDAVITLSNDNLTCAHDGSNENKGVRSADSKNSGKWYFEAHIDGKGSLGPSIGWMDADHVFSQRVGSDANAVGVGLLTGVPRVYHDGTGYVNLGMTIAADDYIMVAVDFSTGDFWFGVNGTWALSGDPANGTNPTFTEDEAIGATLYPACVMYNGGTDQLTLRTSSDDFEGTVPSGFFGLTDPIESHYFGTNNEGADNPSGTSGSPTQSTEWATFDGVDDGYYYGDTLDESDIEGRAVFRIEETIASIDGPHVIWKSGGNIDGIGLGITEGVDGIRSGYYFGVFGEDMTEGRTQNAFPVSNLFANTWYEAFFSKTKLTVRKVDTPTSGFTQSRTITVGDGSTEESIGYQRLQSALGPSSADDYFFVGSIQEIEIYAAGTMTWPSDLSDPVPNPLAEYLFGSDNNGKESSHFTEFGTVTENTDNVEFNGSNNGLYAASWGDERDLAARIVFSADDLSNTQVFWKSGGYLNGIAFGIHDGGVGIFGRAGSGESGLTSIAVATSLLSTGTKYVLRANQGKVAIYNDDETTLIGESTGTITPGSGGSNESVGFSYLQCPIDGTSGTKSYFDGKIYSVGIYHKDDLLANYTAPTGPRDPMTFFPDAASQGLGLSDALGRNISLTVAALSTLGLGEAFRHNFGIVEAVIGFGEIPGRIRTVSKGALAKIDLGGLSGGIKATVTDGPVEVGFGLRGLALLVKDISPPAKGRIRFNEETGAFLAVVKPGGDIDGGGLGFTEETGATIANSVVAGITAGIGFDEAATRINDLFEVGVEAGIGFNMEPGRFIETTGGVLAGLGLGEVVDKLKTTNPPNVSGSVAFTETAGALNYSAFLRANRGRFVYSYFARITGAADGLPDFEFPALKSFQTRLRSGEPSYLSLVLPYAVDFLDAINARRNGEVVIEMAANVVGFEPLREELIRTNFDSVRSDEGAGSQSLTVTGYKQHTFAGGSTALENVVSRTMTAEGLLRFRCSALDFYLKPGHVADNNGESFVVNQVSCIVGPTAQYMDVSE